MASRTASITLDEISYTVHALNMDQLERVADVLEGPARKAAFGILRIALERAEPSAPDFATIEATTEEMADAVTKIMQMAGLKEQPKNPPAAPPATT